MKRRNFISGIGTMSGMLAMSSAMAGKEFAENFSGASFTEDPESRNITAWIFGKNESPALLYEDDGQFNGELIKVEITWDNVLKKGNLKRDKATTNGNKYTIIDWQIVD